MLVISSGLGAEESAAGKLVGEGLEDGNACGDDDGAALDTFLKVSTDTSIESCKEKREKKN